jgi:hypothetical protein
MAPEYLEAVRKSGGYMPLPAIDDVELTMKL